MKVISDHQRHKTCVPSWHRTDEDGRVGKMTGKREERG
jgi:hypothetical protein